MNLFAYASKVCIPVILISLLSCNNQSPENKIVECESEKAHINTIDDLLNESFDKGQFNGNVLIVKNDSILYKNSFGYLSAQQESKLNENSVFNIGSISKEFNGVAIMILQERGLLSVNDTISKFNLGLPDWANRVTVKHLLHYAGGIPRIDPLMPKNDEQAWEILRESDSLLFKPSTRFVYDNSNVFLQKRIIEKVTGQAYEEFIIENVVQPLNMEYSVHDPEQGHPNRTSCYDKNKAPCQELEFISGWLWSTTGDIHKWVKALRENTLISKESYNELVGNPFFQDKNTYPDSYKPASPLGEYFAESDLLRHNGTSIKFYSIMINDFKNNLTIIVLSNSSGKIWGLGHSIHNVLLDKPYKSTYEAIRAKSLQNVDIGIKTYRELKENHQDLYKPISPSELNKLGYELLQMDRKEDAIKIFLLATSEFPDNANLFDSLGECYLSNEQYDLSLDNYEKSLELNPENTNAVKMIDKINTIKNN